MAESPPPGKRAPPRQLRERKQRKLYSDEWALGDDEAEGGRGFSLADKLESSRFEHAGGVRDMHGGDLTVAYLQKNGFTTPLLFREKTGLGLRVPTSNFTVKDVRMCVGSRRVLDVMDVNTQKNTEMTMKDWQRYYDDPHKERLLNVISLEFSHTRLENYVQAPRVVRQIDWVEVVWPRHLKEQQTESTNLIDDMMYPKVQKYCLMSVKGCYTDFHVDFGGTSVWYHILKGAKVFWLIPPTEKNLQLYERWVLSGKQSDVFFGDKVDKCIRVHLQAGNTFFIPTGWIHAVYTPSDSLVFGGNFLHQFGIEKQLKIAQVEDITKVPQKFRYPFFTEMLWYVLERYVSALLGRSHLTVEGAPAAAPAVAPAMHQHLTQQELHGLKAIVVYLHQLPAARKSVPDLINDPIALVKDVRTLVETHRHDQQHLACTGVPILKGPEETMPTSERRGSSGPRGGRGGANRPAGPPRPRPEHANKAPRRRRTRCKKCEACQRSDCGECVFCHDMVKFGGLGRAKQTCNMRQCLQPMLPVTASCAVCHLDGWNQTPVAPQAKGNAGRIGPSSLMECAVCYGIVHPPCAPPGGQVNEDLPNSWECPTCTSMGLHHDYRQPRHFRARQKSSDLRRLSVGSDVSHHNTSSNKFVAPQPPATVKCEADSDHDDKTDTLDLADDEVKREPGAGRSWEPPVKKRRSSSEEDIPKKLALRTQLASQITANSTKQMKKPLYPIRPVPPCSSSTGPSPWLQREAALCVFRRLTPADLAVCARVCRAWAKYSMEPVLWQRMSFVQVRLSAVQLAGIVRRQPTTLGLEWCHLARRQLAWLLARLPAMRALSLAGSPAEAALALRSATCPPLTSLDLSFARCLDDAKLRGVLAPPEGSRPGGGTGAGEPGRLAALRVLRLSGTDITDVAMRYVVQALPKLVELDASSCARVTDAGAAQLANHSLQRLSFAGCRLLTEAALDHLARCPQLVQLDLRHVPQVSTQAMIKFAAKSPHNLQVKDVKLVVRRSPSQADVT